MKKNKLFNLNLFEKLLLKTFIQQVTPVDEFHGKSLDEEYCIIIVKRHPEEEHIKVCKIASSDKNNTLFIVKSTSMDAVVVKLRFVWLVTLGLLPCLLGRALPYLTK